MIELTREEIFFAPRLPGRIDMKTTAEIIGFQLHDLPILVRKKLLTPLGNPVPSAPKWFSSSEIIRFSTDTEWLSRATRAVSHHWRERNQRLASRIQ